MNNKYIFDTDLLVKTKIERVLFESYYPILFTARNDRNTLFLCVCCLVEKGMKKWLVTEAKASTIVDMLSDRITIRDAFLKNPDSKRRYTVISNGGTGEMTVTRNDSIDWDADNSKSLPTAGEYMDSDEDEFEDEIDFYNRRTMPRFDPQTEIKFKVDNSSRLTTTEVSCVRVVYMGTIPYTQPKRNIAYEKSSRGVQEEYSSRNENTVEDLCLAS